jgi:hypothetical protein
VVKHKSQWYWKLCVECVNAKKCMLPEIEKLVKEIEGKPSWGSKELVTKINSASQKIIEQLRKDGQIISLSSTKKIEVEYIKRYDVIYVPLMGVPHYFIVHKVEGEVVYGVNFTSSGDMCHAMHKVEEDRNLLNSYAANGYLCVNLEEAKKSFIRVYESKKEADVIFKKITDHYKKILNLK